MYESLQNVKKICAGQPDPNGRKKPPRHPTLKIHDKIYSKKVSAYSPTTSHSTPSPVDICSSPSLLMTTSATSEANGADETVLALRKVLTNESEPLARRFRALFSLKHLACLHPTTEQTLPAIQAIAAAFASRSALLKHELAYCLGQTRNRDSVPYLQQVVKDVEEDAMCRHEAAEALGALGYAESLDILKKLRDDENEVDVVRETCDIAVDRIIWENSEQKKAEKLKPRYGPHKNRLRLEEHPTWL